MKLRYGAWLLPLLLNACVQDSVTSVALEQRAFSVLGGLDVGEVLELTGADADTIFLPGRTGGAEFVVVPFFASEAENARMQVEIQGGRATLGTGAVPGLEGASSARAALLGQDPARDFESHVHRLEWERETFNRRVRPGAVTAARARFGRGAASAARLAVPNLGDTLSLRVPNFSSNNLCTNFATRPSEVVAVSNRAIIAADLANPAGGLTAADYQRIAQEYDQLVHPVTVENFGDPTDIDNNEHVIVLITSSINERTPPNPRGVIVGTTFLFDLLPREIPEWDFSCPSSNEGEIFYLIAPDPEGTINGNRISSNFVKQLGTTIIAHELQHLVNFGRRLYINNAEELEEVWLNEGLSHMAEELLFYAATPFEPRQNITQQAIQNAPSGVRSFFGRFAADNINNYFQYLENPKEEALLGVDAIPTRGASWSFLRYAADQEETDDAQFFRELVNSPIGGVPNLNRVLREHEALDLMQAWSMSVYSDDEVETASMRYQQPSWNFRSLTPLFTNSENFPLQMETLGASARLQVTLEGGGSAFVRVTVEGGQQSRVRITSGEAVPPNTLRISVIRVR